MEEGEGEEDEEKEEEEEEEEEEDSLHTVYLQLYPELFAYQCLFTNPYQSPSTKFKTVDILN